MKIARLISLVLVIVGGLNWGLWGAFGFDLVAFLLGGNTAVPARIVYVLVGLAAVTQAVLLAVQAKGMETREGRPGLA